MAVNLTSIFKFGTGIFDEIPANFVSWLVFVWGDLGMPLNFVKVTKNKGKISIFKVCYKI